MLSIKSAKLIIDKEEKLGYYCTDNWSEAFVIVTEHKKGVYIIKQLMDSDNKGLIHYMLQYSKNTKEDINIDNVNFNFEGYGYAIKEKN